MPNIVKTLEVATEPWETFLAAAYDKGQAGDLEEALGLYRQANSCLPVDINPELQMVRHSLPKRDPPAGMGVNDRILRHVAVHAENLYPVLASEGLTTLVPGVEAARDWAFRPWDHRIKDELEIVLVVSTGRAGTYGLYKLLKSLGECAYHTMWFTPSLHVRGMVMGGLISSSTQPIQDLANLYLTCRMAEAWDAMIQGKRLIIVNHWDSPFVPLWLGCLGDKAKVIWLQRDRKDFLNLDADVETIAGHFETKWNEKGILGGQKLADTDKVVEESLEAYSRLRNGGKL